MEQNLESELRYSPGDVVIDVENDDGEELIVVEILSKTISEAVYMWDWNMEPIYVSEKNSDSYSEDEIAVNAVYINALEKKFGEIPDLNKIKEYIEKEKIKEYTFPNSRLKKK